MRPIRTIMIVLALEFLVASISANAAYKPAQHRTQLAPGEIAVTAPGNCSKEGATYVLMNDIYSPTTAMFLANNVTLDLNGYTIIYAAGNYEHADNYSFEQGLKGFDVTKAPGAKVSNTEMLHPMDGKMTCLLPKGQEIVSSWINLPVANRTYYATAMVASDHQVVEISIENEQGKLVECTFKFGSSSRVTCPSTFAPRLGGGTVYAMMFGQPAGKYRVHVKAVSQDAVIDCVDLRPAMDVGVAIVEKIVPWAYYKCVLDMDGPPAFFDYLKPGSTTEPVDAIPHVSGAGTVTIKNGEIRGGFRTIDSMGILSTGRDVKIVTENLKLVSSGINANALSVYQGVMKDCRVEVDTPFIINRHARAAVACWFRGPKASEISHSEFIGGQGCITLNGQGGLIHDNLLSGRETVTNHYSLCLDADGAKVYNNIFKPLLGSGISILSQKNNQMYDNTFEITTAPPNNEYGNTDYSTNAIRITDYNRHKGAADGRWCEGNNVYRNKFHIVSRSYEGASPNYKAVGTAIFMSVGGGVNEFHDNQVTVDNQTPGNKGNEAYAIYVGGSDEGGNYYNNTITSNVQPIWISSRYGQAKNVQMYDNTFIKAEGAKDYAPIQCGYYKFPSENIGFYSNTFTGLTFGVEIGDYTTKASEYEFGWTLTVNADTGSQVQILSPDGTEVASKIVTSDRHVSFHLPQYKVKGSEKTPCEDYTVKIGNFEKKIALTSDMTVNP